MAIYKGSQQQEDLYHGNIKIGKIYKGSTLLYNGRERIIDVTVDENLMGLIWISTERIDVSTNTTYTATSLSAPEGSYVWTWLLFKEDGTSKIVAQEVDTVTFSTEDYTKLSLTAVKGDSVAAPFTIKISLLEEE